MGESAYVWYFFEEINHGGDGGLYAELVRNRNFEEHVLPRGMVLKDGYACAPHSRNYGFILKLKMNGLEKNIMIGRFLGIQIL